ncbi:UDP-GlcNAc--UDP-phosphate GlcNAc-1-phosphate transferase [Flavobacterium aquiphilum]|uniref:UDP-GlcNAc--UDP-phosphate GlcNAc-1-phosphate transferase n=1 Tax=Flavobacterium aquiphilum TaxID=3003261 RepID=UPI00247FD49E|nr:UDP-GlcNAc--UDP-phosphate GlcNAc-1-phosphate transferase [Flavobacterium aquiphilum]
MTYTILLLLFIGIELIYFRIADYYNIIDKPNSRSSHTAITLRGGGIIFPIAILVACLLGYTSWIVVTAVVLVAVVSFIDDIKPLSTLPRFISHIIAIGLVFYELNLFSQAVWLLPLIFILFLGWVNVFNFMDGINGITVLYSFVAIASFSFLEVSKDSLPLLITVGLSCCAFGFFNVRKKAKTFAGDVGSISMALFLAYFMIKTIMLSGQIGYLFFLSVYGIDGIITIFTRIKKKENILEPHRSHLYQYLANELGYSHITVSLLYAGIQLLINGLVIYLDRIGELTVPVIVLFLVFQVMVYLLVRKNVVEKVNLKSMTC